MSHYLHVCAGPYRLLLDADGIHEILELEGAEGATGHRDWRGQMLVAVNGRALLGMADADLPREHAGVVYSADEEGVPVILEFDRVERLRHTGGGGLLPLPPVPERAFRLFDGVLPDEGGGAQLYHLRRPLDSTLFLARKEEEAHEEETVSPVPAQCATTETAGAEEAPASAKKRRGRGKRKG